MEPITLTWAARRYLMARYDELVGRYSELPGGGREVDGYHYTAGAKRIFPRYHVVDAILVEVERLDPDRLPSVGMVTETLLAAAEVADSPFTKPARGEIEAEVMAEERRLFATNVLRWTTQPDLRADPLPYRRVMAPDESARWRTELREQWGVENGSWHPMLASSVPLDVLVLTGGSMREDDGLDEVRKVLRGLGRARVVELGEYGADYVLGVEIFAPRYFGAEGVWTDVHRDWIAYASHEGTIAFGGMLAAKLRTAWPGMGDWLWPGWPATHPTGRN